MVLIAIVVYSSKHTLGPVPTELFIFDDIEV